MYENMYECLRVFIVRVRMCVGVGVSPHGLAKDHWAHFLNSWPVICPHSAPTLYTVAVFLCFWEIGKQAPYSSGKEKLNEGPLPGSCCG